MAVVVINEASNIKADVVFSMYNHRTGNMVWLLNRKVTDSHKALIMKELESAKSGEFLRERTGELELRGQFTLVQD